MIDRNKFENLADALASTADLDKVREALGRETVIRSVMAESGEGREVVAEMVDAVRSMGQEAVTDLMEGRPTTFREAVQRYVEELERRDELQPRDRVVDDLLTLLNYPWSDEEERVQLHEPNSSLRLDVVQVDERDLSVRLGDSQHEVFRTSWEEVGSGGLAAVEEAVRAVHRSVLARVIADREHTVHISATSRRTLLAWLERPNGSWHPGGAGPAGKRLSMDVAEGGGVLIRTRPFSYQHLRD